MSEFQCRNAVVNYKQVVCNGVIVVIETPGFINEFEHTPEYFFICIFTSETSNDLENLNLLCAGIRLSRMQSITGSTTFMESSVFQSPENKN